MGKSRATEQSRAGSTEQEKGVRWRSGGYTVRVREMRCVAAIGADTTLHALETLAWEGQTVRRTGQ